MPTYTLTQDNLLALLETQRGQTELCQQVKVWTHRHIPEESEDPKDIKTTPMLDTMKCLYP